MFERARTALAWAMAPKELKAASRVDDGFIRQILGGQQSASIFSTARGSAEMLDAYTKMPWLRAVVHKVSWAVGMTTWRLYAVRGKQGPAKGQLLRMHKLQFGTNESRKRLSKQLGSKAELEEIDDHPLLTLLNTGTSPFLPGTSNLRLEQMYMDLVGEALFLKERGTNFVGTTGKKMVTSLTVVPPTWLRSLPSPDDMHYGIQFGRSGKVDKVPVEDVIYFKDVNPADPYGRGVGHARAVADELQANEAASRTIRTRLENNAIPPFVAMPELGVTPPTKPQIERIQESWQQKLAGPSKGGFVHFLLARFKFEKLAGTFDELQLIPLLENQRNTILQVYGVPPEVFGILNNSNRATIEAAEFLMGKFVLVPRLEFTRSVLQQMLVPEFDERLILEYESPVADDVAAQNAVMTANSWAFIADELRERAGMEALPDDAGKVHKLLFSDVVVPSLLDAPSPSEPPESDDDDEGKLTEPDLDDLDAEGDSEELEAEQEGSIEKATPDSKARKVAAAVNDKTMSKTVVGAVKEGVVAAGKHRLSQLAAGVAFDVDSPYVTQLIRDTAGRQVRRIGKTTRDALRNALADGFSAGEGANELRRRVSSVFAAAQGKRSLVIARTESVRAMNAGQLAATKQAGFGGKQWLATRGDDRTRDTHVGLDGQVVGVDEDFVSSSGARGPHPGALGAPEEDINCRCVMLSVKHGPGDDDDKGIAWAQGLTSEERRVHMWKLAETVRVPIERKLAAAFRRALKKQEAEVLAQLGRVARG
jgi:SPP1 gp7 family putative phage head morphogenesis protein